MNIFSNNFTKILFLIPLILFTNFAYADETEIEMDWLIEGQINDQSITAKESEKLNTCLSAKKAPKLG